MKIHFPGELLVQQFQHVVKTHRRKSEGKEVGGKGQKGEKGECCELSKLEKVETLVEQTGIPLGNDNDWVPSIPYPKRVITYI